MIWIRKIQKHEERDISRKLKKEKKERVEERKRRDFERHGGSHTHVFSIGRECPRPIALVSPSLKKTHSYGNLPYNKFVLVK
jgi:hypothetical protein